MRGHGDYHGVIARKDYVDQHDLQDGGRRQEQFVHISPSQLHMVFGGEFPSAQRQTKASSAGQSWELHRLNSARSRSGIRQDDGPASIAFKESPTENNQHDQPGLRLPNRLTGGNEAKLRRATAGKN